MTPEQRKAAANLVVWGPPNSTQKIEFYSRQSIEARLVALLERLDRKGLIDAESGRTLSDSQETN